MSEAPRTQELYSAQIPAIHNLCAMGWEYLPASKCLSMRGSNRDVVLKPILVEILRTRRFEYKGRSYPLSANAIDQIVRELSLTNLHEGLLAANERIYDKLVLGVTVTEFMPDGKKHHVTIPIIDWDEGERTKNRYQVTEEFELLRTDGILTRRPDIVCFVNGIPVAVIEAKRPDSRNPNKSMVDEGVSQHLRNQRPDEIPLLFGYAQILLAISECDGRYGTIKTPAKFWARWRDEEFDDSFFSNIKNVALDSSVKDLIFHNKPGKVRDYFESLWQQSMLPNEQDRLVISLLRPTRLLEYLRFYLVFDRKIGKVAARYQQFFGTRALISRIQQRRKDGGRAGGVVWHTTGSGKSYTMVFLCKALLLHDSLKECRMIVVTDRTDLEDQLSKTFHSSGTLGADLVGKKSADEQARVRTGKQLAYRIGRGNERIIFSIINKFNTASKQPECYNSSDNIIVLVDEGHRSQGGENHERMRKALPNAAYIAFTGTPLLKDEKTTNKFGPIIHAYSMRRAGQDEVIAPLIYEERRPELDVNESAIDNWFEKITRGLSPQQKADLKKKYSTKGVIYGSANRIDLIAWDIAIHFQENFKKLGLGLKGQVACDKKLSAIRYKRALDSTGLVSSTVIISPPDTREGNEDVDESELPEVQKWWKDNIKGDPDDYQKEQIERFGSDGDPDIIIVVNKLLTGFDEPRNSVLYIDRPLKDHEVIQAVARVNRLHDQKKFGLLIDYRGILQHLDTAISAYQDLENRTQGGYELIDIEGLYQNVSVEYKRLPRLHKDVWSIFGSVKNKKDREQYRQVLLPKYVKDDSGEDYDIRQSTRENFYAALTEFGICLKTALSSRSFFEDNSFTEKDIQTYKDDLAFFTGLRRQIKQDLQETVDYSVYDEQIRRLVDKHVVGNQVREPEGRYKVADLGKENPAAWDAKKTRNETDIIRSRIKRTIEQDLGDDPYAQKVLSALLKEAILEAEALFDHPLRQYRIFKDLETKVRDRNITGIPAALTNLPHARAYYGVFRLVLGDSQVNAMNDSEQTELVDTVLAIDAAVNQAVAENSVNPQNIEAAIRRDLLPLLFKLVGLDSAKQIIDEVISIVRIGISKVMA